MITWVLFGLVSAVILALSIAVSYLMLEQRELTEANDTLYREWHAIADKNIALRAQLRQVELNNLAAPGAAYAEKVIGP